MAEERALSILLGGMSFASMLLETSTAMTKEEVLVDTWRVVLGPAKAQTKEIIMRIVITRLTKFFEYKSIPLTLAIASKLANVKALFLCKYKDKK